MEQTISIRDLRANLAKVADQVENGESITVIRHSKKSFKLVPIETATDENWETVVDFTDGGKEKGAHAKDVLKTLKKINNG